MSSRARPRESSLESVEEFNAHPYLLSRWYFLKLMSLVYFSVFASWYVQIMGLYGAQGILPVYSYLYQSKGNSMWQGFLTVPTLVWWSGNLNMREEALLQLICIAGCALSLLAFIGVAHSLVFALLWFFYLSIFSIGQSFSHFQWDILLLEAGFLTIFYAPTMSVSRYANKEPPSTAIQWLIKWLLFRLMFSSGVVKLLSGDKSWWNLSALSVHYETTCIPNPLSWYAHQLPPYVNQMSVASMFVFEIVFPFLIFVPSKPLQYLNALSQICLQIGIILTGNYTFFNYLTIALCLPLMDNSIYLLFLSKSKRALFSEKTPIVRRMNPWPLVFSSIVSIVVFGFIYDVAFTHYLGLAWNKKSLTLFMKYALPGSLIASAFFVVISAFDFMSVIFNLKMSGFWKFYNFVKNLLFVPIVVLLFANSIVPYTSRLDRDFAVQIRPYLVHTAFPPSLQNFQLVSSYGLFATMTTTRDEIVLEGQLMDKSWFTYEFKYKPGDVHRMPAVVAPHQPRLDWQMWFAPLSASHSNPWYYMLLARLLEGSPDVLALLDKVPAQKPVTIKSTFYNYRYTNWKTGTNGTWWTRTSKGFDYMNPVKLNDLLEFKSGFIKGSPSSGKIKTMYLSDIPIVAHAAFGIFVIIVFYLLHFKTSKRDKNVKLKTE